MKNQTYILIACFSLLVLTSGCITLDYNNSTEDTEQKYDAVVTEVTDGDTVDIRYTNGSTDTVRIFGIDTPEYNTQLSATAEYGVRSTSGGQQCLERYAEEATQFAEKELNKERVVLVKPQGENRGDFGRLLRYVKPVGDDRRYGRQVLKNGLSRVYDDRGTFDAEKTYEDVESQAKIEKEGLWECSVESKGFALYEVRMDAFGSDTENPTEFVEIARTKAEPTKLNSYAIQDESGKSYVFGDRSISRGSIIQIHTCESDNELGNIVWDRCSAVWNNGGDTVILSRNGSTIISAEFE